MQNTIRNLIEEALKSLQIGEVEFVVEHPADLTMGDFSTNVAMVCAKQLGKNPKELAEELAVSLHTLVEEKKDREFIEKIQTAGPGFINFYLSREFFAHQVEEFLNQGEDVGKNNSLQGKKIMVEHTDPNPFKPFHIGHLMTNAIGESIARILEHSGADVSRANYQGDVGLHVAKAMHVLLENPTEYIVRNESIQNQATFIGKAYTKGAELYESDPKAKTDIDALNKKIYTREDERVNETYDWGFKVTMQAFEDLYKMLGTKFDFYFLESQMAPLGGAIVEENLGKIFEESDEKENSGKESGRNRAIIFKGEKHDPALHTRVFMTEGGLPTYEAKELGLAEEKFKTLPGMDLSITTTASEQKEYMKVVMKALSLIHPEWHKKMLHITHGMMRLSSGKMSSRVGNVVTGESLIRDTIALVKQKVEVKDWEDEDEMNRTAQAVGISALKYSILKQSAGGDIVYDFEKSISFEGDSGPYLQYSYARAHSVLERSQKENIAPDPHAYGTEAFEVEKLLYRFPEVVIRASREYEPHYIANYLVELARSFNGFYGNNIIVKTGDTTSAYKVALAYSFSFVMKAGLHLLGIEALKKM